MLATMLSQFRQPDDLRRVTLMLMAMAHVTMRGGYSLTEDPQPVAARPNGPVRKQKRSAFVKKPRARFL